MGILHKKILFLACGAFIGFLFSQWYTEKPSCFDAVLFNVKPATTLFAFDLHGVVLKPNRFQIASMLWDKFPKRRFFKFLFHPVGFYSLVSLFKNEAISEQTFDEFIEQHRQFKGLKPLFIELMTTQWLDKKNVSALKLLRHLGYKCFILSNIWPSALKTLKEKYPTLLDLFDGVYIPSAKNHYVHKPQKIFYEGFKKYLENQNLDQKQIVFIDNNDTNIESANKAGLHALQVKSLDEIIVKLKLFNGH